MRCHGANRRIVCRPVHAETAAPRARAAWAYSGLNQRELANASRISYDRVRAILGTARRSEITLEELYAIADATGVPRPFMERGWDIVGTDDVLTTSLSRLDALEAARDASEAHREALGATVEALAAELADLRQVLRARRLGA
jgi:transcriptional regulator with XRE-family HTH domain